MSSNGSARKTNNINNVLQLIYKHRHQCLKQLLPRLKELIWNDVKDSQDSYGSYPLHYVLFYCTGNGVFEVVKYILDQDPDALYKETNHQMTPIHIMPGVNFNGDVHKFSLESIQRDQLKARSFMMKENPSILEHMNGFGRLPLSEAVVKGCNRIAKQMLKEYPHLASEKEANDRIPLYHAIRTENPIATTLLISSYPGSILQSLQNDHPQSFLQIALASPTLALPVREQLQKILADMFDQDEELEIIQDKLKTATSTLRSKIAESKESAKRIEELEDQLESKVNGGSPSASSSLLLARSTAASEAPSSANDTTANTTFDICQDYYWKQTRQSEIICLKSLRKENNDPSVEDLKTIVKSLARRLDWHTNPSSAAEIGDDEKSSASSSSRRNETKSLAQIAAEFCLKADNPDRNDLSQTIDALNQELIKLEGTLLHDNVGGQKRSAPQNHQQAVASAKRTKTVVADDEILMSRGDKRGEQSNDLWL